MYGTAAGLYKTTDGGKTWKKLTKGLPDRPIGRCGISIYRKDPRYVYALVQTDKTDVRTVPGQAPKTSDVVGNRRHLPSPRTKARPGRS